MSLQLIFSIFLHTHISKASSLRISYFLYVYVSAAYRATLYIALMILFFMSLFNFLLNNSFLWLEAFLALPLLVLISLFITPSTFLDTFMTFVFFIFTFMSYSFAVVFSPF